MKNNSLKKVLALAIALMIVCSLSCAAFADYTPVDGPTNVSLTKYLLMDATATVPPVTFKFAVTVPTAAIPANAANSTPRIEIGIGTPTIADITFASNDATYTTKQGDDTVSLTTTYTKYAKRSQTVSFTDIKFPAPGIYRYIITESFDGTAAQAAQYGITNDANVTRFMDVYVEHDDSKTDNTGLKVTTVVFNNEANGIPTTSPEVASTKDKGFENKYDTESLTLQKNVTGNQGNRHEYFEFKVTVTKAVPGSVLPVTLTDAEANVTYNSTAKTNSDKLTVGADGNVTGMFYLKNGQKIVINNLTAGAAYTIEETSPSALGYTVETAGVNATDADSNSKNNVFVVNAVGTSDATVTFTNNRQGVVPTGIIVDIAPYVLVVLLAGVAILLLNRKKSGSKG